MGPRPILLATGVVCVFVIVAVLLLTSLRGGVTPEDYLIAGVTATFSGLVVVFGALIRAR